MTNAERLAYDKELRKAAKQLGIPLRGNLEDAIIEHCRRHLTNWVAKHGQPSTLSELLNMVGTSLGLRFAEIHEDSDLKQLMTDIPPSTEPFMARVKVELDDKTDAVTFHRQHHETWEQPFLAVINCQGWHSYRRYFSKWHEVVHRLLEGQQLQMAFRRTAVAELRREPEEVLVDRVAGALAFYSGMFGPVFLKELSKAGRLTFDVVDETRQTIAPEASREATVLACVRSCPDPVWFIQCSMRYKKDEERQIRSPQMRMLPDQGPRPEAKLRVQLAAASPSALKLGIRIHPNMQVPDSSIVAATFHDSWGGSKAGTERIEHWETSSGGPIGFGTLNVEAFRVDEQVWALLQIQPQR